MNRTKDELLQYAFWNLQLEGAKTKQILRDAEHFKFDPANWDVYIKLLQDYRATQLAKAMWPEKCPVCGAKVVMDPAKCIPTFKLKDRWTCTDGGNKCYWIARSRLFIKNLQVLDERLKVAIEKGSNVL